MKTRVKQDLTFKSGRTLAKGDLINVTPKTDRTATIYVSLTGESFTFKMLHLHILSDDFISVCMDDLEEAIADGSCPSITGADVEPDGHDEFGFPSILAAAGMI